ncbi:MAG: aminoglycoside phosphotransferase family protein [Ruminococcaceae bacterium]|nr:aminoglycoside phosphotransferase family protein [Oscillospiraceae bacterium]
MTNLTNDIQTLIERSYPLHVTQIQLFDRHFGTEIYALTADTGKYLVKALPLSFDDVYREGPITEFLAARGLRVARLLKNKNGDFVTAATTYRFTVQEFIEGKTLPVSSAPDWFLEASAAFLGQTVRALREYEPLPLRFGESFFAPENARRRLRQYEREFVVARDAGRTEEIPFWEEQICHLGRISEFHIQTDRLTYANSHGDYHIGQAIVQDRSLTVVDWSSACRLPLCFEVATSYVFASPSCADGAVDAAGLRRYIRTFEKYVPLTAYDVQMMPYVLYFWHTMCNYRPDEYATLADSYRPIARLTRALLNDLFHRADALANELSE